jgi:hypothetical protein
MSAIGDLVGESGVIKQFFLYNIIGQVATSMMSPAFNALLQDAQHAHPNMVLTPDILARAVVQTFMDKAAATDEAKRSGIDAGRFDVMLELAQVRIQPADLAEAVLRSYLSEADGTEQARLQGVTPDRFRTLTLLAGDGIGPEQAAEALRRKYIGKDGKGPDSTSYDQAIAESRLHNKWGPVLYELTRAILSPPDLAQAVIRNFMSFDGALAIAQLSGIDDAQFRTMVDLAGDSLSPTDLTIALRRKLIPYDSGNPQKPGFLQGIQQGRLRDMWTPIVRDLAQEWPTPTDALESRLVGQTTTDEAKVLYDTFGGDPKYFDLLLRTRGEAPSPLELGVLANRGDIEWDGLGADKTTFSQGFHEGRWRDKWEDAYRRLAQFREPESTVTLFLSHGVVTAEQATEMYGRLGMDEATIKRYIDEANLEAYSDYRGIAISSVLSAYYEQILTHDQTLAILTDLHVDPRAAEIQIELQDVKRAFDAINNAISRIRSLYAARKITVQTARASLVELGIDGTKIDGIIAAWQIENSISVKVLTETQIADAFYLGFMTEDEALSELSNLGYSDFDAWILLSLKEKALIKGKPKQGPPPLQGQVIPGTT